MEARSITQIGLVQVGVVLGGFLLVSTCVKIGYGDTIENGSHATWSILFILSRGLALLLIPLVWVAIALAISVRLKDTIFDFAISWLGIIGILLLICLFLFGAAEGLSGPPRRFLLYAPE
jgi:hypothetical protein